MLKTEDDNRVFPTTDASITVINALRDAAAAAGVSVRTQAGPVSIGRSGTEWFNLTLATGELLTCDLLLLATGGAEQGYEWAASMGHKIEPPVPSLFTFTVPDARLKGLSGISVEKAELRLGDTDLVQRGPLLITHWGFSGPAALKLSAWGARVLHDRRYETELIVNWAGIPRGRALDLLKEFRALNQRRRVLAHSPFALPHRLWERLAVSVGLPIDHAWADLSNTQIERLADSVCENRFIIRGKSTFKEEFVTCGGVCLDDVDFRTMESRICRGLYFAGEILDIDGITGGFNFQSAWTTGWLAGRAMAKT